MRIKASLLFAFLVMANCACAANDSEEISLHAKHQTNETEKNNFIGSWELVSGEYVENKNLTKSDELQLKSMKILSGSHYSYITYSKGKFYLAGGGTYTLDDNTYTEISMYTSYGAEPGRRYAFTARIDGDIWENKRVENGVMVEHEIWKRVK